MRPTTPLALALVSACAYRPGSFANAEETFVRARVSIECLDVAIERRPDLEINSAVVGYAFGNRCDRPAIVDLASVQVVGRTRTGANVTLVAYDPERELKPLWLDAHAVGREAIAYATSADVTALCLDVGTIARARSISWICVDR